MSTDYRSKQVRCRIRQLPQQERCLVGDQWRCETRPNVLLECVTSSEAPMQRHNPEATMIKPARQAQGGDVTGVLNEIRLDGATYRGAPPRQWEWVTTSGYWHSLNSVWMALRISRRFVARQPPHRDDVEGRAWINQPRALFKQVVRILSPGIYRYRVQLQIA